MTEYVPFVNFSDIETFEGYAPFRPTTQCWNWCAKQHEVFYNNQDIQHLIILVVPLFLTAIAKLMIFSHDWLLPKFKGQISERGYWNISHFLLSASQWMIVSFFIWYFFFRGDF